MESVIISDIKNEDFKIACLFISSYFKTGNFTPSYDDDEYFYIRYNSSENRLTFSDMDYLKDNEWLIKSNNNYKVITFNDWCVSEFNLTPDEFLESIKLNLL